MNASAEQLASLVKIALGLGELREHVVLVGGAAVGLLITDSGAAEARVTVDVDLIVQVASQAEYYGKICKNLRSRGFVEDSRKGAPICRWVVDGQTVDVVPVGAQILGFSNVWYPHAIATALRVRLTSGGAPVELKVISAPAFLATKLTSFASRGGGDLLHEDIEDIVALVDGRKELISEVEADTKELRAFVARALGELFDAGLEEQIPSLLRGDAASQAREPAVVRGLQRLARVRESGR
jgi:hypothetical protein